MAICYKKYKLESSFSDGRQDPANGKWFARTVYIGTTTLDEIATNVAYDCTITKADCKAVIEALIHEINNQLLNSYSIKLDGLGTFKVTIKSRGLSRHPSSQRYKHLRLGAVKILPAYGVDAVGLSKTKCIIRKVSKDEAAKTRKPCGYCYGHIRRGKDLNRDSTYIAR